MSLFLTEQNVTDLLPMAACVKALDAAFRRQSERIISNHPRRRLSVPNGVFHFMESADIALGRAAIKLYSSFPPKSRFLVLLFDVTNGDLLSVMEGDKLGQIRTGAASGVATDYLSNESAEILTIFGSGWQAESQAQAIAAVRKLKEIRIYSRDADRRKAFAEKLEADLSVTCVPSETPDEALQETHIISTATTSRTPVFDGNLLPRGVHVNAIGSNMLSKAEIDLKTVVRANRVVVDSIEQAKIEAGDLVGSIEARKLRWEGVYELHEVVSGNVQGRRDEEEITLFKSVGLALEDVAAASLVYDRAIESGIGKEMDFWSQSD